MVRPRSAVSEHFTPTSASWLNLVERWFATLTEKQIKRGVHRGTRALEAAIREYLTTSNWSAAATAMTATTVLAIPKEQMIRLLHDQHALSDRFITYMLARNIRIEEDLIDQLFNSSAKRLARTLLLLARYGKPDQNHRVLPRISQETLAEMIGTTRSRVNFFMNKFKKLGFIEYNGGLKVNHSLLTVILHG
jgi:CRP-like cAMP-binding protein